ncbi:unnamed protein product [Camellia sinensis]
MSNLKTMAEIEKSFNGLDLSITKIQWFRFVYQSTLTNPLHLPGSDLVQISLHHMYHLYHLNKALRKL